MDYDTWMGRLVFLNVSIRIKLPLFHILVFLNITLKPCIVSFLQAKCHIVALRKKQMLFCPLPSLISTIKTDKHSLVVSNLNVTV